MTMTAVPKRLFQENLSGTETLDAATPSLLYTIVDHTVVLRDLFLSNLSDTRSYVRMYVVPSGETLGTKHILLPDGELFPGEMRSISEARYTLHAGDGIYFAVSGDVNITMCGGVFTEVV